MERGGKGALGALRVGGGGVVKGWVEEKGGLMAGGHEG